MTRVQASRLLPLPAERAWALLANLSQIHRFAPGVDSVRIESNWERGPGAARRCRLANGAETLEEVVSWSEGSEFATRFVAAPAPLAGATAAWRVEPVGDAKALVAIDVELARASTWIARLWTSLVAKPRLRRELNAALLGLEVFGVTGLTLGRSPISAEALALLAQRAAAPSMR